MREIPKEWQPVNHWEAHVCWMKDQPTQWNLDNEAEARDFNPNRSYSSEDDDNPGWWPQRGLGRPLTGFCDTYEEALDHITKVLKKPDLGEMPGIHFSKSEHIALIREIHQYYGQPIYGEQKHNWVRAYGNWALKIQISHIPFRKTIKTTSSSAINPLRSLEGRRTRVESIPDAAPENADSQLVVEDILYIEEFRVQVGGWNCTFEADSYVEGSAYPTYIPDLISEPITIYSENQSTTFYFYDLGEEPK